MACRYNAYADLWNVSMCAGKLLKIVSDIDDTLMCSGGHWPAGCDRRYPRKCIYPGALAFFKELDTRQALRVQVRRRYHPNR
jgi:hypothetical protein